MWEETQYVEKEKMKTNTGGLFCGMGMEMSRHPLRDRIIANIPGRGRLQCTGPCSLIPTTSPTFHTSLTTSSVPKWPNGNAPKCSNFGTCILFKPHQLLPWLHLSKPYLFFFFGHTCGLQKFLGQGSNWSHSCNQSHSSDNIRSLTQSH